MHDDTSICLTWHVHVPLMHRHPRVLRLRLHRVLLLVLLHLMVVHRLLLLLVGLVLCLRPGSMELLLGLGPCHIDHLLTHDLLELLLHLRTTDTHGTCQDDDDD
jgi:hypothetical protein